MATEELKDRVFTLVASQAASYKGTLDLKTPISCLGLSTADLTALATAFNAEFGLALDLDDMKFNRTMTGVLAMVDANIEKQRDEVEHALRESSVRAAFDAAYPPAYLASLARRSQPQGCDLVELLWAGFANGFSAGCEKRAEENGHS